MSSLLDESSSASTVKPPVIIYADGACKGNPGKGGWGVMMQYGGKTKELYGGEKETTNNRMELTAVVQALNALTKPCTVDIYTDSQYVMKGMMEWMKNWKRNGWKTSDKKPVKNVDLWQALDAAAMVHVVSWHWVKGHAGNPGNERADALANLGVELV
jgi:ribonuclease HI